MVTFTLQNQTFDVDAAIFDLDGTLVDTLGDFCAALNRMLGELGLPLVERGPVSTMVGKGSEHLLVSVLNHVLAQEGEALSAIDFEALYTQAWPSYQRHYGVVNGEHAQVYPGVRDALHAFAANGIPLACVTNKPTAFATALLESLDLHRFLHPVFGGDAFEKKKPDPLPLLRACASLGSAPERTLMVGDSANDAQAGRAAGCPVVLVTYGYNHGEPARSVDADAWVDSLAELTANQ